MKQTMKMFLLMVIALSVTAGADAHCLDHAAAGPIRLVIGVDRSLSTAPAQANVWLDMAMKLVKCLRPGDAVTLLEIHANTAQAAPVFEAQLLTYLRLTGKRVGLLINFNSRLLKEGIKRMIL